MKEIDAIVGELVLACDFDDSVGTDYMLRKVAAYIIESRDKTSYILNEMRGSIEIAGNRYVDLNIRKMLLGGTTVFQTFYSDVENDVYYAFAQDEKLVNALQKTMMRSKEIPCI